MIADILGFSPYFFLFLAALILSIILISKKFKLSKNKTILVITVLILLLFILPLSWFGIIQPTWHSKIREKIVVANYCTTDSDCVIEYFDSFTCGSYVNKKEVAGIYDDIRFYRLINSDGCNGLALASPICKNNKCVGKDGTTTD